VSPPETATDATRRLEMRLGDFGIPRKFIDEFTGHHTVSTTTRALWSFCRARQQTVMFWAWSAVHCAGLSEYRGEESGGPPDRASQPQDLVSGGPMELVSWLSSLVRGNGAMVWHPPGHPFREQLEGRA